MEITALDTLALVALTLPLIALWVAAFWDIARRRDLSVVRKLTWSLIIVLTAYIGIAIYAIARPVPPPPGKVDAATLARASAIVGALEQLVSTHANGEVSDEQFKIAKRDILGLAPTPGL